MVVTDQESTLYYGNENSDDKVKGAGYSITPIARAVQNDHLPDFDPLDEVPTTSSPMKVYLERALSKAKAAILSDEAKVFEDAIVLYGDACKLLRHIESRKMSDGKRRKIQRIVSANTREPWTSISKF